MAWEILDVVLQRTCGAVNALARHISITIGHVMTNAQSLQSGRVARILALTSNTDPRGTLVAIENGINLPFLINRLFYVVGMTGTPRGFHAHRREHQLLVCASGSCRIVVDDGAARTEFILDQADQGLYLPPLLWVEISDFSTDCVVIVIGSDNYDEADYIRDYPTFLAAVDKVAAS